MATRKFAGQQQSDPYQVLGVERGADDDAVKKAYRKLALKWHPDRNTANKVEAEKEFKRISEAYQLLIDPGRRSLYDRTGSDGSGMHAGAGHAGGPMTREEAEAMFKQMFGDKPVHEIVRELEKAMQQQSAGMKAQEQELRDKVQRLRAEALELHRLSNLETHSPLRRANLMRKAVQKSMQADQADQAFQMMGWQHIKQRLQAQAAISQVRQMDPEVRAAARKESAIQSGISWGVALGAYFGWGWGFISTLLLFLTTRLLVRTAFAFLRISRAKPS